VKFHLFSFSLKMDYDFTEPIQRFAAFIVQLLDALLDLTWVEESRCTCS